MMPVKFIFAATVLYVSAALSYLSVPLAITAGIGVFVCVDTVLLLILALCILPFMHVFALQSEDLLLWHSVALIFAAARIVWLLIKSKTFSTLSKSAVLWFWATFSILVVLHFKSFGPLEIRGVGFLITLGLLLVGIRAFALQKPAILSLTLTSLAFSALLAGVLSFLFQVVPIPALVLYHGPLEQLRLLGVFEGTNAAARYLLVAFSVFLSQAVLNPKQKYWLIWLIFTTILICMTKTKIAIAALFLMCGLLVFLLPVTFRKRSAALFLMMAATFFLWTFNIERVVDHRAAEKWVTRGETGLNYYLEMPEGEWKSHAMLYDFRIGYSAPATIGPDGKVTYEEQPFNLVQTGGRDRLWKAGIETIVENPWWGIGYKTWQAELQKKLSFPNRSPHNGLLEVAGAYGILGGALYLLLTVLIVKNLLRTLQALRVYPCPVLLASTLAITAFMGMELVDASATLAVTPCAIWFWILLAIQEIILQARRGDLFLSE